jgi:hypothetical protein
VVPVTTGTSLYFAVDGYFTLDGGAYLLSIGPLAAEGSSGSPTPLGGAPTSHFGYAMTATGHARTNPGDTDAADSYYQVTVTDGKSYRVEVSQIGDKADLWVYPDSTFTTPLCSQLFSDNPNNSGDTSNQGGGRLSCSGDATSTGTLYIVIDGFHGTLGATTFQLRVNEQPSSGNFNQISLSGGTGSVQGIVKSGGNTWFWDSNDKFYYFTPAPGKHYRVSIPTMADNVDLYVFRGTINNWGQTFLCQSRYSGTTAEVCDSAKGGGNIDDGGLTGQQIVIGVDGFSASAPATFTVKVEEIP